MKIVVNLNDIDKLARDVDSFCESIKNEYWNVSDSMILLETYWSGEDESEFMRKFKELDDEKSQYKSILLASENYSKRLKDAATRYRDVQFKAVCVAKQL